MNPPMTFTNFLRGFQDLSTNSGGDPLAGGDTFTGDSHDVGLILGKLPGGPVEDNVSPTLPKNAGHSAPAFYRAMAASDQTGTLTIQQSQDDENWFITASDAVAADFTTATVIESKVVMRYQRTVLVNGGDDQTDVEIDSCFVGL